MTIVNCYFCDEQEEVKNLEDGYMFFCDDCQRWQCNTEKCGCICSLTGEELFDWLVDAGTSPQELVDSGLKNLKVTIKELIYQHDSYQKFCVSDGNNSNQNYAEEIAERIYDEAEERIKENK